MQNHFEQQIFKIAQEAAVDFALDIVQINCSGPRSSRMEILVERTSGDPVAIDDCRKFSKTLSAILDIEDIMQDKYNLEISSAGIERPLVFFSDFKKFAGREVLVKLKIAVNEKKKYQGIIDKVDENNIKLRMGKEEINIPYENIRKANLVMTDEMFRALLNKNNNQGEMS